MTSIRLLRPRRFLSVFIAFCCLLGGLVVLAEGQPAGARPESLRPGSGRHAGRDFVGYYLTRDGTKVYCLSPRRATPAHVSLRTVARYPGLSATKSAALAYALSTWGNAHGRDAAAVESQVVNTLAGNHRDVARRARALPAKLRRLTAAHVTEARTQHGPYRVAVTLPKALLPGASATGSVRVLAASGRPVKRAVVRLQRSANVAAPNTVRTGVKGTARFRYRSLDVGQARIRAVATGLPSAAVRVSSPRPGQQRLASGAPRATLSATAAYRATPTGISRRYACSSECAGRPTVTLSACAKGGTARSRIVYRVGSEVLTRTFVAGTKRRCSSTTLTIADRTVVSAAWQYRTKHGWSHPVTAGGAFVVDCPPVPALTVTVGQDCERATVTVRTALSTRPVMLAVAGRRRATVTAAAGRSATWTTSVPCGTRLPVTVRSGVRRVGGGWNLGPAMSLTTP